MDDMYRRKDLVFTKDVEEYEHWYKTEASFQQPIDLDKVKIEPFRKDSTIRYPMIRKEVLNSQVKREERLPYPPLSPVVEAIIRENRIREAAEREACEKKLKRRQFLEWIFPFLR
jgi:hypothetical protein